MMLTFILILSILGVLLSIAGAFFYLVMAEKSFLMIQRTIFERAFVRCFYFFVASVCVLIASCSAVVLR